MTGLLWDKIANRCYYPGITVKQLRLLDNYEPQQRLKYYFLLYFWIVTTIYSTFDILDTYHGSTLSYKQPIVGIALILQYSSSIFGWIWKPGQNRNFSGQNEGDLVKIFKKFQAKSFQLGNFGYV